MVGRIVVGNSRGPGAEPFDYWVGRPETESWRHVPGPARELTRKAMLEPELFALLETADAAYTVGFRDSPSRRDCGLADVELKH